ncbi:MAG: ComEC/Rec2 family competence protein [Candidatus Puniceispirillaceae bacterium]
METMQRSPERLAVLSQFYLCWCFIALICGIVMDGLLTDYGLSYWWVSGLIAIGLFWIAGRLSFRSLASFYICVVSGWVMLGISAASFETALYEDDPVLAKPYSGVFALTVEKIHKRTPNSVRLEGSILADDRTDGQFRQLSRIRVSLYHTGQQITEGDEVMLAGRLFPLSPPAFANSPDFSRNLRLRQIGATGIGYEMLSHVPRAPDTMLSKLGYYRHKLASRILAIMAPEQGAIASAMLVGERDYVEDDVYDDFRKAGLAHLLAISGLHMGIFCFFIFSVIRFGCALVPHYAMRVSVHKYAAILALFASLFYLFLTGFPVSAIRAFLMSSLVILAIISDRLALTYRNLALVGIAILISYPSAIYTASFQLSFSATFALVTAVQITVGQVGNIPVLRGFLFLSFSSALITLFSLPFAIWHFASISLWGVISNMLAIPLTGMVIMPAGVVMLVSLMLGLPAFGGKIMELSLGLLIEITRFFAALPGSAVYLYPPEQMLLLVWNISIVAIMSVRGFARPIAMGIFILLIAGWLITPQTDAVIFRNGSNTIFAIKAQDSLVTSKPVSGFWQFQIYRHLGAANAEQMRCDEGICSALIDDSYIGFVESRFGLTAGCRLAFDLLISPYVPRYPCDAPHRLAVIDDAAGNLLLDISDDAISVRAQPQR